MPSFVSVQILGNNEAFEPFTSNLYTRRVLSGDFIVVNKYMMADLMKLGLWNKDMRNVIIAHRGSIQAIPSIPAELKELYKTVWEIKMKVRFPWTAQPLPVCSFFFPPGVRSSCLTVAPSWISPSP